MLERQLGGCIELGFQRILKDFLMMEKSRGIQSRLFAT